MLEHYPETRLHISEKKLGGTFTASFPSAKKGVRNGIVWKLSKTVAQVASSEVSTTGNSTELLLPAAPMILFFYFRDPSS